MFKLCVIASLILCIERIVGECPIESISIRSAVDNDMEMWLNGEYIGTHSGWTSLGTFNNLMLVNGKNVLAIKQYNGGGPSGVYIDYETSNGVTHVSSNNPEEWQVYRPIDVIIESNWMDVNYNEDSRWSEALMQTYTPWNSPVGNSFLSDRTSDAPVGYLYLRHTYYTDFCTGHGYGRNDPIYSAIGINGYQFKYDGICQYSLLNNIYCKNSNTQTTRLLRNSNSIPSFNVMTRHGRKCGGRSKNIVCIDKVLVNIDNNEFIVSKNNEITINGKKATFIDGILDINSSISISQEDYELKSQTFERIKLETKFGLTVIVSQNGAGSIWLEANNYISDNSCGMLANSKNNNLVLRNGRLLNGLTETNYNILSDSWMIPYKNQPFVCDKYPKTSFISSLYCDFDQTNVESICEKMVSQNLKLLTGNQVETCFSGEIDATRIYDNCITEVCNCGRESMINCVPKKSIDLWQNTCKSKGINFIPLEWNTLF